MKKLTIRQVGQLVRKKTGLKIKWDGGDVDPLPENIVSIRVDQHFEARVTRNTEDWSIVSIEDIKIIQPLTKEQKKERGESLWKHIMERFIQ